MSKKTSEWEKEFDRLFLGSDSYGNIKVYYPATVKSFISDLLAKEKMELVERIEGKRKDIDNFKFIGSEGDQIEVQRDMGYNQALDDVISALKSEEKEEEVG